MPEPSRKPSLLRTEDERDYNLRARRILFIDDAVDAAVCGNFCRDLVYISERCLSEKLPIWIILNSPGGDVYYGIGIHDAIGVITARGITVNIVGMGLVASMASVIIQAGTKRFATPHTQFLLHQVSDSILFREEEVNVTEERADEMKRINRIVMNIIAQRIGLDIEELLAKTKKLDYWLDVTQAKAMGTHGVIDEVITELPF